MHAAPRQPIRPEDLDSPPTWLAYPLLASAVFGLAQLLPAGPIRAVVALPVALTVPGFLLMRVLLRRVRDRDIALQAVFSVALSIATAIGDAVILNLVGIGLTRITLEAAIAGTAAVYAGLGIYLVAPIEPLHLLPTYFEQAGTILRRAAAVIGATLVAVLAVWFTALSLPSPEADPTTSFSLGSAWASLPAALATVPGQPLSIPVDASQDHASSSQPYQLTTAVDGKTVQTRNVVVPATGVLSTNIAVDAPPGKGLHRVEIELLPLVTGVSHQLIVYLENRNQ